MGLARLGPYELGGALRTREIRIPLIPVLLGGAAMVTSAYWAAGGAVTASFALTLIAILAWRLPGGADGFVKDVTGPVFATAYLALPGATVAAMLAPPDGSKRVLTFVVLTIASDIGGYFAGITLGPWRAQDGTHHQPEEDVGGPGGSASSPSWPAPSWFRSCCTATGGRVSSSASPRSPRPSSATWPSP